jgi:ABC-type anion transport system duplicated permease subunit
MTFSFYSSLKSVPPDLVAVGRLARLSWWQRFSVWTSPSP